MSTPVPDQVTQAAAALVAAGPEPEKSLAADSEPHGVHQLKALHGLRFFAAFCILFSHGCTWLTRFPGDDAIIRLGEFFGVYGMPLFFVLSGFVIHYNYQRLFSTMRTSWAIVEFLGARFARIYPLFVCFFLVGIAVDAMIEWYNHHPLNLFLVLFHTLTLTQSWVYIVIFGDRLVLDNGYGLSWSLSTEFFFYLLFVVLVMHVARLRRTSSLLLAAGLTTAVVFGALVFAAIHRDEIGAFGGGYMHDPLDAWSHSVFRWFFYYSPYVRVFEFVLGCLTAQLHLSLSDRNVSPREARLGRWLLAVSLFWLVAFSLVCIFGPFGAAFTSYLNLLKLNYGAAIPIAVLIFCVSRYSSSRVASMLSVPFMVLLGELSYSIYTVHTWTLRIFERPPMAYHPGIEFEAVLRIGLAIALTVILSTATWHLIEVPARSRLRRMVAAQLTHNFGTRERNMLPAGQPPYGYGAVAPGLSFVLLLVAILAYQFLVVPEFSPYTR